MVPPAPAFHTSADLPALSEWVVTVLGILQSEVTIRQGEHVCMDELRRQGVIR